MFAEILRKTVLFHSMSDTDIEHILNCLKSEEKNFMKNETICHAGETVRQIGIILSGSANIENNDAWGNRTLVDHIGPGQIFAETYACLPLEPLMVNVVAAEDTCVLFLDTARLLHTCPNACIYHVELIRNLLAAASYKNLNLSRRIFLTSSKSIRGRLLSFLSDQAIRLNTHRFTIPFNRQQLADYLGVDRSALSNELSKMQREGLVTVNRNSFHLLKLTDRNEN